MVSATLTSLAEHSLHPVDHLVQGGSEVLPCSPCHDLGGAIDMHDDLHLFRMLLIRIYDVRSSRTLLVLAKSRGLRLGPIKNLGGNGTMPLRNVDPHSAHPFQRVRLSPCRRMAAT